MKTCVTLIASIFLHINAQSGNTGRCSDNLCKNGARCRDIENTNNFDAPPRFVCFCSPGWAGPTCEIYDSCSGNNCQNGAICIPFLEEFSSNQDSSIREYACDCEKGWEGELCDINVDPCRPNPCFNDVECTTIDFDEMTFICSCGQIGRFGDRYDDLCFEKPSPCVPNPCWNDVSCQVLDYDEGEFECSCPIWRRENRAYNLTCHEKPSPCNPNPCKDGVKVKLKNMKKFIFKEKLQNFDIFTLFFTCIVKSYDHFDFQCDCPTTGPQYERNCELKASPCDLGVCPRHADCVILNWENLAYDCVCPESRQGRGFLPNCESRFNPCTPNPCWNETTCITKNFDTGEYGCVCPVYRRGDRFDKHCREVQDPCEPNPCWNRTACRVLSFTEQKVDCNCNEDRMNSRYYDEHCRLKIASCPELWKSVLVVSFLGVFLFVFVKLCATTLKWQCAAPIIGECMEFFQEYRDEIEAKKNKNILNITPLK